MLNKERVAGNSFMAGFFPCLESSLALLGCAFMLMPQTFSSLALMFPPTFLLISSIECTRIYDKAFGTT